MATSSLAADQVSNTTAILTQPYPCNHLSPPQPLLPAFTPQQICIPVNFPFAPLFKPQQQEGKGDTSPKTNASGVVEYDELTVLKNCTRDKLWICLKVDGVVKVVDVTKYAAEHPGGAEVIEEVAGKEWSVAHNAFEDIGHQADARAIMRTYIIGNLKLSEDREAVKAVAGEPVQAGGFNPTFIIILVLALAVAYYLQNLSAQPAAV